MGGRNEIRSENVLREFYEEQKKGKMPVKGLTISEHNKDYGDYIHKKVG